MSAPIQLVGNLGSDPELKFTAQGKAMAKLTIVTSKRKPNAQGVWEDTDTTWWNVTVWDKTAEHVADSLQKGDPVIIIGTCVERSWQNADGETRKRMEVNATNIGADLRRWAVRADRARAATRADSEVEFPKQDKPQPDDSFQTTANSFPF